MEGAWDGALEGAFEGAWDGALDPLPLAFTVRSDARDTFVETWLMLSLGLTGSSNFDRLDECETCEAPDFECRDECREWCDRFSPTWLIESSGVMCVSMSTVSRNTVLGVALSGSGMSRAEQTLLLSPFEYTDSGRGTLRADRVVEYTEPPVALPAWDLDSRAAEATERGDEWCEWCDEWCDALLWLL